ncbi:SdpI family protein [Skermania piniformis]|uniref:SdpI family protein n=1 Tax=Skermania pinensis TaxID=39122 RepID=A0ABX8S7R4_9ACTN|nr:SdpI family protein [Skermania piniformis]QXQ13885.1 SdpI family protein [Skermania piniformis]
MFVISVVLFVLAAAGAMSGLAGWFGRLPRSSGFGVRTEASMQDDAAFRTVNRAAAPAVLTAAVLIAVAGAATLALPGPWGWLAALGLVGLALGTAGIGATVASQAAAPVADDGCGQACGSCALRDGCAPAGPHS